MARLAYRAALARPHWPNCSRQVSIVPAQIVKVKRLVLGMAFGLR
jgi:hypothetical protein